MNTTNNWNWLKDLEAFERSRNSLLRRSPTYKPEPNQDLLMMAEWSPAIELGENKEEYLIKANLAEVNKEDVKVTAENGLLTIVAHRKFQTEQKHDKRPRVEPACGSFGCTFSLPDDASPGNIRAMFKDSVLVVQLAKGQNSGLQQVEVKIS
jgi:HSP20 family protein